MTTKTLDDILKRILNDSDIFGLPHDKKTRAVIPKLFEKDDWERLKEAFIKRDSDFFNRIVDEQCQKIKQQEKNSEGWRKNKIERLIQFGTAFKNAYQKKHYLLEQLFNTLDSFGIVECKLPNMEDYGKVIENYDSSIVKQYFLYKIEKASGGQRTALRKALEYVKELYAMNLDRLEIAFIIRKLNYLTQFMEVIDE